VGVARRFFGALASEPAGSRSALQEAVSSLAGAYSLAAARRRQRATAAAANDGGVAGAAADGGDDDRVGEELQELLLGSLDSDQAAVRLCAIQV
jgi:hypothetical protein